ncbi:hypothetical protein HK098_006985 [Nowakowskiella sp. JEL0407]|nr:hypothetical protein HK098_006985 [Nowakowskiella sp. JEL0407]
MSTFNEQVLKILIAHSLYEKFVAGTLNVEICPREDVVVQFSRPFMICRNGNSVVRIISEYDISYNPYCEFRLKSENDWNLLSIYTEHEGLKVVGEDISKEDALKFLDEWAQSLQWGYSDKSQSKWIELGKSKHHAHL